MQNYVSNLRVQTSRFAPKVQAFPTERVFANRVSPLTGAEYAESHRRRHRTDRKVSLSTDGGETRPMGYTFGFHGVHHVGLLCSNLEKSLEFYQEIIGLETNPDRPHDKLPYRGAWLWIGTEMIHLMELPNPDPLEGRAKHGGRDRHICIGIQNLVPLMAALQANNVTFTLSESNRRAVFMRDPDMNTLEIFESEPWR